MGAAGQRQAHHAGDELSFHDTNVSIPGDGRPPRTRGADRTCWAVGGPPGHLGNRELAPLARLGGPTRSSTDRDRMKDRRPRGREGQDPLDVDRRDAECYPDRRGMQGRLGTGATSWSCSPAAGRPTRVGRTVQPAPGQSCEPGPKDAHVGRDFEPDRTGPQARGLESRADGLAAVIVAAGVLDRCGTCRQFLEGSLLLRPAESFQAAGPAPRRGGPDRPDFVGPTVRILHPAAPHRQFREGTRRLRTSNAAGPLQTARRHPLPRGWSSVNCVPYEPDAPASASPDLPGIHSQARRVGTGTHCAGARGA